MSAVRGNMTGVQIRARVRVHAGARGPHLPGLHLPRRGLGGLQPPGPAGRRAALPGLAPRLRSPHPGGGLDNNYLHSLSILRNADDSDPAPRGPVPVLLLPAGG